MNKVLKSQLANYAGAYPLNKPRKPRTSSYKPSKEEIDIFRTANKAWKNYSRSSNGRKMIAASKQMDLEGVQKWIKSIFSSSEFGGLRQKLASINLPFKSFSIGLNLEVEFILGFTGTIGLAIGIGDSKNAEASAFISLGVTEGVDEGGLVGVQFGLWKSSPADMGGFSFSGELVVGFGLEFDLSVAFTFRHGFGGIALSIGLGEEDGISIDESYTFVLGSRSGDGYLRPVHQTRKKNLLIIKSIECKHPQNDGGGSKNEIYFTFEADDELKYYYPTYDYYSMGEGDTWDCGRSVWFDKHIDIKIYDEDDTSGDDKVAKFKIKLSDLAHGNTKTFSDDDYSSKIDKVEYKVKILLVVKDGRPSPSGAA